MNSWLRPWLGIVPGSGALGAGGALAGFLGAPAGGAGGGGLPALGGSVLNLAVTGKALHSKL